MRTLNSWAVMLATVLTLITGLAQAEQRPPIADKVQAYSGENGLEVWTLRIGERSAQQALVQLVNVDHDWNKRIQKMSVEKTTKDTRYYTQVDGKKFVVMIVRNGWGELYLPDEPQVANFVANDRLASQGNAQAFLTDYLDAK